jgi:hypothetical protein
MPAAPGPDGRRGGRRLPLRAARAHRPPRGGSGRRGAGQGRELPLEGEVLVRPAEPRDPGNAVGRVCGFPAPHPGKVPRRQVRVPGQHRSRAAAGSAGPDSCAGAGGVRHHELLDPVPPRRAAPAPGPGARHHGQRRRGPAALRRLEHLPRRPLDPEARAALRGDQAGRVRRGAGGRAGRVLRAGIPAGAGVRSHRRRRCVRRRLHGPPGPGQRHRGRESAPRDGGGSATGSFAVEEFSVNRFDSLTSDDVQERVLRFGELVRFDMQPSAVEPV